MVASRNDVAATGLLAAPVTQPYDSVPPAASPFLAPPPYFVTPPLPSDDHVWDPTWYEVRTAVASCNSISTTTSPRGSGDAFSKPEHAHSTRSKEKI